MSWTYIISHIKDEEIVGTFYEKELQRRNQKEFRVEKVIKRKDDKVYVKWKAKIVLLTLGLIKKHSINEYFPEPKSLGGK